MKMLLRGLLGAGALCAALFLSLDWSAGDLRYDVAGQTVRHWSLVPSRVEIRPACAAGFIRSGGGPCGAAGAGSYTLTGPSSAAFDAASSNYTVQPVGSLSSSVVVTPADATHACVFSPTTVTLIGAGAQTFTCTPLKTGTGNLSVTNSGTLTNPAPISVTVSNLVPGYPTMPALDWPTGNNFTLNTGLAGDPFGASNGSVLIEGTNNSLHSVISTALTITATQSYTIAAIVKPGSGTRGLDVQFVDGTTFAIGMQMSVDPSACAVTGTVTWGGATISGTNTRTANLGAGWCLVQMTGVLNSSNANVQFFLTNAGNQTYVGDGTSSVNLYGPVVE